MLALAHELANGRAELTPVHLAVAMVRDGRNRAVTLLRSLGVPAEELERQLEHHLPPDGEPRATRAADGWAATDAAMLAQLEVEATTTGARSVLSDHLLLVILRDTSGIPARLLAAHGVDHTAVQARLRRAYEASRRRTRDDRIEGLLRFVAAVVAAAIEIALARSAGEHRWPVLAISGLVMAAASYLVYRRTRSIAAGGMSLTAPVVVPLTLWLGADIARWLSPWPVVLRFPVVVVATFLIGAFLFVVAIAAVFLLPTALRWRS